MEQIEVHHPWKGKVQGGFQIGMLAAQLSDWSKKINSQFRPGHTLSPKNHNEFISENYFDKLVETPRGGRIQSDICFFMKSQLLSMKICLPMFA